MSPLLDVRDVSLKIGGQVILDSVSLSVSEGETLALIGPNGAGKTSLFNSITRTYRPQAGSILYDGVELLKTPAHALAGLGIARTFQGIELLPDRTVLENVMLGAHRFLKASWAENLLVMPRSRHLEKKYRERARQALAEVNLESMDNRLVRDLSYSQQKFVEIARCLTLEPRLLLLDEPVSGLSQKERAAALEVLARLHARGSRAILLVEHDLSFVRGIATRLVALDFGVVIAEGDPGAVLSSEEVIRAYIGEDASNG